MTDDETKVEDPLVDRAQVRIFTLADHVAQESSGKLYISGAGLEWIGLPIRENKIMPCFLALRLAFPRAFAREIHTVVVRVVDRQGQAVGPDPLLQAEMRFELRRVPKDFAEVSGNLPVRIEDYPLSEESTGIIFFQLVIDGTIISQLPVQLLRENSLD